MYRNPRPTTTVILFLALLGRVHTEADVRYVDQSATGANNGTSWVDAFVDLQDAIAAAVPGDEVWVAAGVYTPAPPTGPRYVTFALKNEVAIYGGFLGTEVSRHDRDWSRNPTILSGDLNRNDGLPQSDCCLPHANPGCDSVACEAIVCGIDATCCSFVWDSLCVALAQANCVNWCGPDNSYIVVSSGDVGGGFEDPIDSTAILDGFVISRADGGDHVGGMLIGTGSPAIKNCTIEDNYANDFGAIWVTTGSPTFDDCVIRNNTANNGGVVGVGLNDDPVGAPQFRRCVFESNVGQHVAGAVSVSNSASVFEGCVFIDNASPEGVCGGVLAYSSDRSRFVRCTFRGNRTGVRSVGTADALLSADGAQIEVDGCHFIQTPGAWTAMRIINAGARVRASTFRGTGGDGCGARVSGALGSISVTDCILWTNCAGTDARIRQGSTGSAFVNYSCLQGDIAPLGGVGNTNLDPVFATASIDDYHLNPCSPLVNLGTPDLVPDPGETDLDGDPRVVGGRVDMGADEVVYTDADSDGFPDNCSTPGSCCDADGSCAVTLQGTCGGTWTVGGTCAPNLCPQPGSCCGNDGSCTVGFESACTAGTWTLGGSCTPNACPQPGSCCEAEGVCSVVLQADCPGPWTPGGTCDPAPCLTPFTVSAAGGRYLAINVDPAQAVQPLALRVTSPDFPCLSAYVNEGGLLGSSPVFRSPAAWGMVYVGDSEVVPSTRYNVQVESANGLSGIIEATTWRWGDTNNTGTVSLDDILCVLAGFSGSFANCALQGVDLVGGFFNPDRVVTLDDILAVLGAFSGNPYGASTPCS